MGSTFQLQLPMRRQQIEELAKAEQLFLEVIRRNPNESMGLHLIASLSLPRRIIKMLLPFYSRQSKKILRMPRFITTLQTPISLFSSPRRLSMSSNSRGSRSEFRRSLLQSRYLPEEIQ